MCIRDRPLPDRLLQPEVLHFQLPDRKAQALHLFLPHLHRLRQNQIRHLPGEHPLSLIHIF